MTCRGRPGLIQPPLLKSAGLARGKTGFFFASLASLREEFSRLSAAYVKLISHDPALFHGGIFRNRGIVREGFRYAANPPGPQSHFRYGLVIAKGCTP